MRNRMMMMSQLQRWLLLRCQLNSKHRYSYFNNFMLPSPSLGAVRGGNLLSTRLYSTEDSKVAEMAEKARSTAEEFLRQAKEKKNEISDAAKETLEDSKETVLGETDQDKDKFKEKVEKGDYDRIGRPN